MALLSIITIVFNRKKDMALTFYSVRSQTFKDIEYIVVDGGSTDGTAEFLYSNKNDIQHLISEKDKGIYDAMNKGLALATGKYINFMNAGDSFHDKYVLEHIFEQINESTDAIYGDTVFVDENGKNIGLMSEIRKRPLPTTIHWKDMKDGMLFCHQSFIVRRSLCEPYSLRFPLSADVDWIIACLKRCSNIYYFQTSPIAHFQLGGSSQQKHFDSLKDRFYVLAKHFGFFPILFNHVKKIFK